MAPNGDREETLTPVSGVTDLRVGLNSVFYSALPQAKTVYSSSPNPYRSSCTSKPVSRRTRRQVSREKMPIVQRSVSILSCRSFRMRYRIVVS